MGAQAWIHSFNRIHDRRLRHSDQRQTTIVRSYCEQLNEHLIDFFDASALATSVCELLNNAEERKRLGANARVFAQANYDLQSVCLPRQLAWVE